MKEKAPFSNPMKSKNTYLTHKSPAWGKKKKYRNPLTAGVLFLVNSTVTHPHSPQIAAGFLGIEVLPSKMRGKQHLN